MSNERYVENPFTGETKNITEWARELGYSSRTIFTRRLKRYGTNNYETWQEKRIFARVNRNTIYKGRYRLYKNPFTKELKTMSEWAEELQADEKSLRDAIIKRPDSKNTWRNRKKDTVDINRKDAKKYRNPFMGKSKTLKEWALLLHVKKNTLRFAIYKYPNSVNTWRDRALKKAKKIKKKKEATAGNSEYRKLKDNIDHTKQDKLNSIPGSGSWERENL